MKCGAALATPASSTVDHLPRDAAAARRMFADLRQRVTQAGIALRDPPAEPTTCCGRGCHGCVWEGFYGAADHWREEALLRLARAVNPGT